ncbi:hypothetical protein HMPREF9968_0796 [Streptococcus oralis SK255]|uniref:Uncharacterized protein n=1 Tax=Streptococcus oralis SK255 TaxID=1005704 RepID=F5VVP5_STROR|nr:hypothetical protein HMPREF9968_0796 [Streptococcus oralis SK255]
MIVFQKDDELQEKVAMVESLIEDNKKLLKYLKIYRVLI